MERQALHISCPNITDQATTDHDHVFDHVSNAFGNLWTDIYYLKLKMNVTRKCRNIFRNCPGNHRENSALDKRKVEYAIFKCNKSCRRRWRLKRQMKNAIQITKVSQLLMFPIQATKYYLWPSDRMLNCNSGGSASNQTQRSRPVTMPCGKYDFHLVWLNEVLPTSWWYIWKNRECRILYKTIGVYIAVEPRPLFLRLILYSRLKLTHRSR